MRAHITALVVTVKDEIETRHIIVRFVNTHHVRKIAAKIEILIRMNQIAVFVLDTINVSSDGSHFRPQVHGIFVSRIPVIHLAGAFIVLLHEDGLFFHGNNSRGKHRHGMAIFGHGFQNVDHILRHFPSLLKFFNNIESLFFSGNVTGEQQVQKSFHIRHFSARNLG